MKFARTNGLINRNCDMDVVDEKGKSWLTTLCTIDRVCIRGLKHILAATALKKGDEILLELVENGEKPLMNLHGNLFVCVFTSF